MDTKIMCLILWITALAGGVAASRVNSCAPARCPVGEKFQYKAGHTYYYNYYTEVDTTISGATHDFTSIFIEMDVEIHSFTSCEFSLKLRNVNLRSRCVDDPAPNHFASGYEDFKETLEKYTVHFAFEDGAIDALCVDPAEKPWALNIKRAIVSMLQNRANINDVAATTVMEKDIQGKCPTTYLLDYNKWDIVTAKKTKDLNGCEDRSSFISALKTTPLMSPRDGRPNSLLRSTYSCKQTIDELIFKEISCEEHHYLRPFSNGNASAVTYTKQKLNYIEDKLKHTKIGKGVGRLSETTLLFDYNYHQGASFQKDYHANQQLAEVTLQRICIRSQSDVQQDSPLEFWKLITTLQKLDYPTLKKFYDNIDYICSTSSRGRKLFRDALPSIGTPAAVKLMVDIISSDSIPQSETDWWLDMIAFHPRPTDEIISTLMLLVKSKIPSSKVLLSLSSLMNSYCQKHPNCRSTQGISDFIAVLKSHIEPTCSFQKNLLVHDIEKVVIALKALGNLGQWVYSSSILEKCITTTNSSAVVRIAAIDAYRRLSCDIPREHLFHTFSNMEEDAEIRIAAYLGLMKCPTSMLMDSLLEHLRHETINQVNAFVWSHLKSIQDSADPCKREIKAILEDVELNDKYFLDIRKFSRVWEKSAFSEILNLGGHLEAHLIYSPQSYIPRSAMVNLTTDFFGNTINLLELSGRLEGFERLAESLFRPKPYSRVIEINPAKEDDIKNLDKNTHAHALANIIKSKVKPLPIIPASARFSMKMFGQEVWYTHTKGDQVEALVRDWTLERYDDLLKTIARQNSFTLSKDFVLLDTTYAIPLSAGLPLILSINATASAHLKLGGKLDIRDFPASCEIEGQIRPSAAISLSGAMMVDGYFGKSGVGINANLHTATVLDEKIVIDDNNHIKIHHNIPRDKINFFQVKTDLILRKWDEERPLRSRLGNRSDVIFCSNSLTSRPLGVDLCLEFKYPNASFNPTSPYFPLTGNTQIGMWLQKTDSRLTSYQFHYQWDKGLQDEQSYPRHPSSLLLSFNTPHSLVDREWILSYTDDPTDRNTQIRLITPFKKIFLKGQYNNDASRKGLSADVTVDNYRTFSIQAELQLSEIDGRSQYLPKVVIYAASKTLLSLESFIDYNPGKFLKLELSLEHLTLKPFIFKGDYIQSADQAGGQNVCYNVIINSPLLDSTIKGSFNMSNDGIISKSHLEYQQAGNPRKDTIDLTMKLRYISPPSRSLTTTTATIDIYTSAWPEYNSIVHWNFQFAEGHVENTISVDTTDRTPKVQLAYLEQILNYRGNTLVNHGLDSKFEVKIPSKHVDLMFNINHRNTERELFSKIMFRRTLDKDYGMEVWIHDDSEEEWRVGGHLIIQNCGDTSTLSLNVTEIIIISTERHKYIWRLLTTGRPFGNINATMHYNNFNTDSALSQGLRINIDGDVQFFGLGSMHLADAAGHVKGEAKFSDQNYCVEMNYTQVQRRYYEGNFTMVLPSRQKFYGKIFLKTSNEKLLQIDVKSNTTGRRVIVKTTLLYESDLRDGQIYLEWDADRDPRQRLLLKALDERRLERGHLHVGVDYMEKTIGFLFNHHRRGLPDTDFYNQQVDTILEWSGSKKFGVDVNMTLDREKRILNGNLDALTPVSFLEEVGIDFTHSDDGLGWKSDANLVVNRELPFSCMTTGKYWKAGNQKYLEVSANASTPYNGFKHLNIGLQHSLASREVRSNAVVEWSPNEKIDLHLYGVIPNGTKFDEIIARLRVTTPFQSFKNLILGFEHGIDSSRISSAVKVIWNEKERLVISLKAASQRIIGRYNGTASFILITPMDIFSNLSMQLEHSHHSHGFLTIVTGFLPNGHFSCKGEGIFQRTDVFTKLRGGIDLQSPNLSFGSGLHYENNGYHVESELRGNWNVKKLHLTAAGTYRSMTDFHFRGDSITHFKSFKTTTIILANRVGNSVIVSELVGQYGNTELQGIRLVGNWDWSRDTSRSLNMNFKLNAPFPSFPYILLNVTHYHDSGSAFTTHFNGTWNNLDAVVDHKLEFQTWYHFNDRIIASLPFDGWHDINMIINQSWGENQRRTIVNLTVIQAPLLGLTINFVPRTFPDGKRKIDVYGKLESSLWASRGLEIIIDHIGSKEEQQPKIIIQTITTPKTKLIDLHGFLRSFPGNKIWYLKINSAMSELRDVALTGMYSMSDTHVIFNVSAHKDPNIKWEVDGRLETDVYAPRIRLNIITPKAGYRIAKFDGHFSVWMREKQLFLLVQKEDWKLDISGTGRFDPDDLNAGMVIKTLNPDVHNIYLNVTANWDKSKRRGVRTSLTWGHRKNIAISAYLQPNRNGVTTMSISATTPVARIRNVDGVLKISRKPDSRILLETSVRWNRADVVETLITVGQDHRTLFDYAIIIKSTSPSVPQVAAILLSKTISDLHTSKASLEMNNLKFNIDMEAKLHRQRTEMKLLVETPFAGFPKGSLDGTIQHLGNKAHNVDLTLLLPLHKLGPITLTGSLTPAGIMASTMKLSFPESARPISLTTQYTSNNTGFLLTVFTSPPLPIWQMSDLEIDWNSVSEDVSLRAQMIAEGGRHEFQGSVKGPSFNRFLTGHVSSSLLKHKTPIDFELHILTKNQMDIRTTMVIREAKTIEHWGILDVCVDEPTSTSLNFAGVTPLIGNGHWYNVSVDVRDTNTGIASVTVLSLPTGTYRWKAQYDRDLSNGFVSLMLEGETPIETLNRLKIYATKTGLEWDNLDTTLEIVIPIKGYHRFGAALSTNHILGELLDTKLHLTTPFEGYEDIGLQEHLNYKLDLKSILSETTFTYAGVKAVIDAQYENSQVKPWKIGIGTKWNQTRGGRPKSDGTVSLQWQCSKQETQLELHSCQIHYQWIGTPWEGRGSWNYSGWRKFAGDTSVDVPIAGIDNVVVIVTNDMPSNRDALKSRIMLQWAGRTMSDVLLEGVVLENGQKNGSFSLITPFTSAHRVNGGGFIFRDDTNVRGGINLYLNDAQIFRGLLKMFNQQNGPWNNRTLLIEAENPWQPLGLELSAHRHPLTLIFQSSITRNLAELQNGTKSLKADIEVFNRPHGRDMHLTVCHPRHRMDISATYHRELSNFTHAATLRWGTAKTLLAAYRLWKNDSPKIGANGGQSAGIRWEHPNRVMMATANLIRKSAGLHSTNMEFKWDASGDEEKRMNLDVEYEDKSGNLLQGRSHQITVVFWHPRLSQNIQLNATVGTGHGLDLLRSSLTFVFSDDDTEKLTCQVAVQRLPTSDGQQTGFLVLLDANHDASNLDTHLTGQWFNRHDGMFANVSMIYLNRDYQRLHYLVQGSSDFLDRGAKIQIQSPNHFTQFDLDIFRQDSDNNTVIFRKQMDKTVCYVSKLLYRPISSYVELNMTSVEDGGITFSSGFKTPKELNLRLWHGFPNRLVQDVNMVLRLNTSHFLTARAYWIPELRNHIQETIGNNIIASHNKVLTTLKQLLNFGISEVLDKTRLGWDGLARELQPVLDEIYHELDLLSYDFQSVRTYLNDTYTNNDFFVKDLLSYISEKDNISLQLFVSYIPRWDLNDLYNIFYRYIETLEENISEKWDHYKSWWIKWLLDAWNNFFSTSLTSYDLGYYVSERISSILSKLPEILRTSLDTFESIKTELNTHISKLYSLGDSIKSVWDKIQYGLQRIRNWIKEKLVNPFISWVLKSYLYRLLTIDLRNGFEVLIDFLRYRLVDLISKLVEAIKVYMGPEQKKITDYLMNTIHYIRDFVWTLIPNIINHPAFHHLTDGIVAAYQKVTWILHYYEIAPDGYTKIFEWYFTLVELFTTKVEESSDHFDSQNYIQFETERGIIEMDQQLPFSWKSLKQSPAISEMKEIQYFNKIWGTFSSSNDPSQPSYSLSFTSWGSSWMDRFNYRTWLPPFHGQAVLAGNNHYVTFDGQIVQTTGDSTYILTHDWMDSNFTIFINSESRHRGIITKRSLSLLIDGRELDIRPDFQVLVDGKKVELPHSFGNTSVVRESEKTIVRYDFGLTVICHWTYDVCTIKVSGWYFGRLTGLLGTYNNEQVDDARTPDGISQASSQLKHWTDHWSINPPTIYRGTYHNYTMKFSQKTSDKIELCYNLFNNSLSILGYCYKKIDPSPFLDMCQSQNDACTSAAGYVLACNAAGITMRMPRECVKCHLPDGQVLQETANITMNSTNVKRGDIVFIIEAKKCNREIVNVFQDLVNNIDSALNLAGVETRRYATVVFGGSGVYDSPHVLTSVNEIFTDYRKVTSLTNFKTGRGTSDFFDALRFAAKLPFQPGAAKTFVALTCSIGESVEMRADYPEVHRMSLEDGITVHLLLDREFEIKTSGWLFYGIDGVNAYTSKDSRAKRIGDPDLRRQVMPPKDICVPIALESNGTVFTSLYLYANKKTLKNFLDVYSRRIAQSAEVPVCHSCDCLPDEDAVGRIYCQPCIFPKPAHIHIDPSEFIEYEDGIIYYNSPSEITDVSEDYIDHDKKVSDPHRNKDQFKFHTSRNRPYSPTAER